MHCFRKIAMLTSAILAVTLAWGQGRNPRQSVPVNAAGNLRIPVQRAAGIPTVTPSAIYFSAVNPDTSPTVNGNAQSTYTFMYQKTAWALSITAPSTFSGCSNIPASAVMVSCVSATTISGCNGDTVQCAAGGPWPLSATGTQVAVGSTDNCADKLQVVLNFTFTDDWKYPAATCTLPLTYAIQ